MPTQSLVPAQRRWEDLPWKERNILGKISYVICCMIGGIFACFIFAIIIGVIWNLGHALIILAFNSADKAFDGQLSQIPWWGWAIGVLFFINRWLRTLVLLLAGGLVGSFVQGQFGFLAGVVIVALVYVICAISRPRRAAVVKEQVAAKEGE
jgi:hypothetical protein